VAASEQVERAGNDAYQTHHMSTIFEEGFSFSGYERDLVMLNRGDGTFLDVSGCSGLDSITDGRGSLTADFDNDGDLDVFLTAVQGDAFHLFRNQIGSRSRFLRVTLAGTSGGPEAYGATVRVGTDAGVRTKTLAGGSGYVSQGDPRLLFGLGAEGRAAWVEVAWPNGATRRYDVPPDADSILVREDGERATAVRERRSALPDPWTRGQAALARAGLRYGDRFPDLAARAPDGSATSVRSLIRPGRTTLVNLWATWCVPCAREVPELQRIAPDLRDRGVDVVGLSVDVETADGVAAYLRERGVTYPTAILAPEAVASLFGDGDVTVPLTVRVGPDGRIVEAYPGWSERTRRAVLGQASDR